MSNTTVADLLKQAGSGVSTASPGSLNPVTESLRPEPPASRAKIEDPGELKAVMAEMLAHDSSALLDDVSARLKVAMPPRIGRAQAAGFGLWLAQAVIYGRGTEIVDAVRAILITERQLAGREACAHRTVHSCYVDAFHPEVGIATLKLLERLGCSVEYPVDQTCCGQPMTNSGCHEGSAATEALFVRNFSRFDYIVGQLRAPGVL